MWGLFSSFDYSKEWKAVDDLMRSNPKSALSKMDAIEKQAKSEGNAPQQIRCIINRGNAQCYIDNTAFVKCMAEMKKFQKETKDEVARSVATYMIGKLYLSYYEQNSYRINQRTNVDGLVPEDIEEWTSNIFVDKIRECSFAALSNEKLKTVLAIDYEPILEKGEDSRIYCPTLYDLFLSDLLVTHHGIADILSHEEMEKYERERVAFHANDKERDAYVYVKLELLQFLHKGKKDRSQIISELESLLKEVKNDRASILVRIDLCDELQNGVSLQNLPENSKLPQRLKNICDEGIKAFPKHKKINGLKQVVEELSRPTLSVSMENSAILSSDKVRLNIRYANMKQVKLALYRLEVSSMYDYHEHRNAYYKQSYLQTFTFDLPKSNYCVERNEKVELPALDLGIYRIKLLANEEECITFSVSDLYSIENHVMKKDGSFSEYVVVDAKTGAPKPKVNLLFRSNIAENVIETIENAVTDDSGFATISLKPSHWGLSVYTYFEEGKDRFKYPDSYALNHGSPHAEISDNAGTYLSIFTDRSIYRPSQTVYYKVVAYKLANKSVEVLSKVGLEVKIYDTNYQLITTQILSTNEFGSAASSFVIPAGRLSGNYRMEVRPTDESVYCDTSKSIRVEEYKRPTFEVKMTAPTNSFSFGDTITLKGRADYLLGTPVSGAKVDYTVVRKPCSWWWFGSRIDENTVAEGSSTVADDGSFDIPFLAKKKETDEGLSYYYYEARVKVTDANGETHEATISLSVGDRSLFFSADSQKSLLMDDFATKQYRVANLNGEGQVVNVSYEVLRDDVSVAKGNCLSDEQGAFSLKVNTQAWQSGAYKVNLKALDEKGREVTASYERVLYRKDDKRPPVHTILWSEDVKNVELPYGEEYKVRIGSSLKEAHLLLLVRDEQGEVEKRWIDLSDEIKEFSFKLEAKNGENLNVKFFLVNEAVCHEAEFSIRKKEESKALPIKLSVFRDKMLPGSKETWTLTLPKDKQAEVLAAMYDASLDQLYSHSWSFSPFFSRWCRFSSWYKGGGGWKDAESMFYTENSYVEFMNWSFDDFMNLPMGYRRRGMRGMCVEDGFAGSAFEAPMMKNMPAPMVLYEVVTGEDSAEIGDSFATNDTKTPEMQVRENFAETAFFYPQLTTDKEGSVQFSFEMPESLTRWNFKALAHTKDLFFGQMSAQMVTQKDFMISPNLPRFLRKGDRCVLSAKVINLSESNVQGTAFMEFLDPVTEKVVAKANAKFTVEANKNSVVTCSFDVPRDWDAVLVRTSAVAGNFSDAEQTLLPILSDRMVVTQSLPLYVRGGQTKNYTFENLVNNQSTTLFSRFLKLEFAKDPIWYAVQALPSVATVEHDNVVSYSAAHFAALMSQHIAKSNPKIFNVINTWKQQGLDKQTLLSNLEKNQDVKNVLLNESPWVMEAKNETEMKQRLSTLFDVNDLQGKSSLWFDKLKEFRLENGGYCWFKCDYPSLHSTLFVLDNLGRLRKAGIADDALIQKAQCSASLRFLDNELREKYESLKKNYPKDYKKVAYVGMTDLYYFQVHSLFPEVKVDSRAQEAFSFYYDKAKAQWKDFSLYGKALAAIAFHRNGDKELAKTIVESIREFSTTTDEMGMFWQNNVSGYFWSDAAISTHTRIMEALEVVDPKGQEQDEMRLWLLNQKRTQNWDNTIANVDALNVLLLSGSDWLSNDNKVTIKFGDMTVQPKKAEAGTGYFTEYVKGDEVKPSMGHVELKSKSGGNISWGALYWQFEEEIDKVLKNKTALHVEKMVMLEVQENGKPILKQINEGTKLSVGDKLVVRLTLRTDRDMDYVSLKDQRASCLEPTRQLSGYRCSEGTCYYQSPKDAAMYYFFDHLAKGTYVFEYPLWVTHSGDYCNGITTAQCLYAPEFLTNTGSVRIRVEEGK